MVQPAATPKFEVKRHGASDYSNNCRAGSHGGYSASNIAGSASHLAKRLTRLSGLARSGALVAMLGSWLLLLPTIPLMNAARVVKCWARRPLGSPGYHCFTMGR